VLAATSFLSEFGKKRGSVILGFPTPLPLILLGYSVLSTLAFTVEHIPQSRVHESLTTEYLLVVSWALLIFVAVLAKELQKVLSVKVADTPTR
jgi:hypothetical protein